MAKSHSTPERTTLWPWLGVAAVLGVGAYLLRAEGRLWICSCGTFSVWASQVCSSDNSQQLFDPYSFTHVLHGFLYFWVIILVLPRLKPVWQLWLAIVAGTLWEVFENSNFVIQRYRTETAFLGYQGDTVVNSLGDILCAGLGFWIARSLGLRRSLILFLVIELIVLLWIKDSLILEIVMLVRPINAIKAWQMCR